jgi:hypothetical protein
LDVHAVIAELGMYWPQGVPGQLHEAARAYRQAARDIAAVQAACRSRTSLVRAGSQGPPIDGFAGSLVRWHSDQGLFSAAIRACNQLADACDIYAREIERTRHRIIALAAAAAALGAGTGPHGAHLGPHARAIVARLVAASWAERTALSAAVARGLVAAGLVGGQGMALAGVPGNARPGHGFGQVGRTPPAAAFHPQRSIAWGAAGRSVAPLPAAGGLAAGTTEPWRGPAMALRLRPGAHAPHLLPIPTHRGAPGTPTGSFVTAGLHLLTAVHVDVTEVLVGTLASAAGAAGGAVAGSVGAARASDSAAGVPDWVRRVRPPSRRHHASSIGESTWWKDANSVISPSVDVQGDVDAVRSGRATYEDHQLVDGRFLLPNGRVYGVERLPDGTRMLYPVSGPGIDTLSRIRMKALGVYNRLGDTPRAAATLESNLNAEPADRRAALHVSSAAQDSRP